MTTASQAIAVSVLVSVCVCVCGAEIPVFYAAALFHLSFWLAPLFRFSPR